MISLRSPAKLNLFLRILKRREDGFHELASLFQTIDLCDGVELELQATDQLICDNVEVPRGPSNLIFIAADLFRKKTKRDFGLKVTLDKRIPMEAGLGGGSSNAATALWGLNQLYGGIVSEGELQGWAAEIGSDVPFFFSTGTAYCTGRGECVRSLDPLSKCNLKLVNPEWGLSTPQVYKALKVESLDNWSPEEALASWRRGVPYCRNDLETSAFTLAPQLSDVKAKLASDNEIATMTGSGTSFFCLGDGHPHTFISRSPNSWYF